MQPLGCIRAFSLRSLQEWVVFGNGAEKVCKGFWVLPFWDSFDMVGNWLDHIWPPFEES